jgi:transcription antitermination factor NusG
VVTLLAKKRIEAYCPFNRAYLIDRKRATTVPLFPSYVFVRASDTEHTSIIETDGFVNFIYWLAKPAVICHDEIITIKKFLAEYNYVCIEKSEVFPNDKVRILNGPLVFWEGHVVEVRTNTVKILLPSLGYFLVAEIQKNNDITNKTDLQNDLKKVI